MKAMLLGTVSTLLLATAATAEVPTVVTDFGPVQAITQAVMAGVGAPEVLLAGTDTVHSFAMRPSHARMLAEADLVIWAGSDLSPWLEEPVANLAGSATTLELLKTEGWTVLPARSAHDHDHGHGDEAHGDADHDDHDEHDDHAAEQGDYGDDPHAWLDPAIVAVWAGHIATALGTVDPANADAYAENAAAFAADMTALEAELAGLLQDVDASKIVFGHDTTQYFEARFGVQPAGFIAQSDAAAPGPARLQDLRAAVVAGSVTCILGDSETNPGDVATLIEGTAAQSAMIDVTTATDGGYAAMMRQFVQTLADCKG